MSISEDVIMRQLEIAMTASEAGDAFHHLHVVSAPPEAVGLFGEVPTDKLQATVYAIDPGQGVREDLQLMAMAVSAAAREALSNNLAPLLVSMALEVWIVLPPDRDELSVKLQAAGRLQEHPKCVEMTAVYGVCRDGRRWRGRRILSGPRANETQNVEMLVGEPVMGESGGIPIERLMRKLVGLHS